MSSPESIRANRISYRRRQQILKWIQNSLLVAAMAIIVFPIYWAFLTSIRPVKYYRSLDPSFVPTHFTWTHYQYLLTESQFPTWFTNSAIVSLGVIVLTVTFATMGGYGLARLDIKFKRTFARGVLAGYMFPPILLGIPMYIIWQRLGIINSHLGLILAETALALPFSLWLMWNFFQSVPYSLEESAQMAGATRFRAFVDVALPMARPGIIAIIVFSFAVSWNEYTLAKILISSAEKQVITAGLGSLIRGNLIPWGPIMAATFIAIIPAFLLVYFLQKYLIRGFRVTR